MCSTLNEINNKCETGKGEKIIINEATFLFNNPKRGEIVVFKPSKEEEKYYIKRVIGLPGETVSIKNGEVYITEKDNGNTFKLQEDYLNTDNKGKTTAYFSDFTTFKVPEGSYFMLGDNRRESTDSRSCFMHSIDESCKSTPEKAFVKKDLIRGKAFVVWWPLQDLRLIKEPVY